MRLAWKKLVLAFRGNPLGDRIEQEYDQIHNVDTSGNVDLDLLRVDSPNVEYGNRYQAINPHYFTSFMKHLPADPSDCAFVDIGSGKGRALFLASEYPFKEIIGVEFARELHECALRNIKSYRNDRQRCFDVRSVCVDAAQFEFPLRPLVIYMNNPFEEEVMVKVIANLRDSVVRDPRPMWIIYINPTQRSYLVQNGFKIVAETMVEKTNYLILAPEASRAFRNGPAHAAPHQPPS